jgi:hypothetical protein
VARSLELVPLAELQPHPENPKAHDLGLLRSSVDEFGFVEPIVRDDRTGFIISGHGRRELLLQRKGAKGAAVPEGVVVRDDGEWLVPVLTGWESTDDAHARAALVALNQVGIAGGWDDVKLLATLQQVDMDGLLKQAGFADAELKRLLAKAEAVSEGSLLASADVTLGEPTHKTKTGEVYRLGGRHHLVVDDVMSGWPRWAPLLVEGALFVPYPGPYAALGLAADRNMLVMVQPEPYLAGHLLDKYATSAGADAIEKLGAR